VIGVGAILNERFVLDKELGQGGMGTVYRATDQVLGRNVAIKFLKDSGTEPESERIRLEAQILARLVHDKIVRLYDFGESDGSHFLVMEEVNGPSFASRWPDLHLADRLRICGQVAEALDYAHLQGVIHRDVKPGNVLLTATDEAKLSDFGLSLVSDNRRNQSGTIRGTPCYMSPEQAQGKSLDHRTDLYSVGVMLYECATGDVPFVGHAMSVLGQHINSAPTAPRVMNREISPALESLILLLLEKRPTRRPPSANVVALALIEEAERARRLQQINPGLRRSHLRMPVDPTASRTLTVDDLKAELTPANGTGRVDPEHIMSSATGAPRWALPRHSDNMGIPPSPPKDPLSSSRTSFAADRASLSHRVAREMLASVLATPIVISPEERYLCGHYLAYILGGSQRRGIFLRRPLDARNSDRARLLLAMTWLSSVEPTQEAIERASILLEGRPDVRAELSPVVVIKYLASRDTLGKRKRFRHVRKRLQDAGAYARKAMLDRNGVLNPGMMPRTQGDLATIAPRRDTLDGHRVSLWNRVAEVWRQEHDFRRAILRYTTRSDQLDAVSADLWPEVVYPLIERAHWQRTFRPRHEALWDYVVGKLLHVPVPGVRLDRMMVIAIPLEVAKQLDLDLFAYVDDPGLPEEDEASPTERQRTEERRPFYVGATIPRDEPESDDDVPRVKAMVPLSPADPFVFTQDSLRNLWEGAMVAQDNSTNPDLLSNRTIPVGPYRFAVIPTRRGRSAVRAVLQGMQQGKEIEILTPLVLARESASRTVIAIWVYRDGSAAVVHLDFQSKDRYILWHAPNAHQFNFAYFEELRERLSTVSLEVPDQLDRILSKK
jgi:eukaryotic-like serine/threonine-protein kinase